MGPIKWAQAHAVEKWSKCNYKILLNFKTLLSLSWATFKEMSIGNGGLFWYEEWWGNRRVKEQKGEECRECYLRLLLVKNRQNLNPFAAQVSLCLSLSLKFVSMLWSNSITFSVNSFSFGIGKNKKNKKKDWASLLFFPLSIEKNKHYRVFIYLLLLFFSYYSLCLWLYSYVFLCQNSKDHFVCLMGQKGFVFLPQSWVLAQVFLNSELGLWFSWSKVFYDILSNS